MEKRLKPILYSALATIPLFFVFIQSNEIPDRQITPRVIAFSILIIAAGVALFFKKHIEYKREALLLLVPAVLFFIWSGTGITYTINAADGYFSTLKTGLLTGSVLAVYFMPARTEQFQNLFIKVVTVTAFILTLLGLFELIDIYLNRGFTHQAMYEMRATMGHKNIFSEYLLLLLPFTLYAAVYEFHFWKWSAAASSVFILIICTLSMTRSVWAAGFFSFLFIAGILFFLHKKQLLLRKKLFLGILVLIGICAASFIIYAVTDPDSLIVKQLKSAFNFTHGSVKDRLVMWQKSLTLAAETPVAGGGPGSWKVLFLQTGNEDLLSSDHITFYQRPHNDFLWVLNEHGIIGLLMFSATFAAAFYLGLKNLRRRQANKKLFFSSAVLFSLTAYTVISQFSFPKERPAFLILLSFLWGFILLGRHQTNGNRAGTISRYWVCAFLILIGAAGVWIGSERYKGEKHMKKVLNYRSAGNNRGVIKNAKQAESMFYTLDDFSTPVQWYAAGAQFNLGKKEEACKGYESGLNLNPYHIYILNDLGTCRGIEGKTDEAFKLYRKSLQIAPYFEETLYNITTLHYQEKQYDSAIFYFQKIRDPADEEKYKQYLHTVVIPQFEGYIQSVDEAEVKKRIKAIQNTEEWVIALLKQAEETGKPFKKRVIHNALHDLKKNGTFSNEQFVNLLEKYQL